MVKQLILFLVVGTAFAQQPGEPPAVAPSAFSPTTHDISRYQDIWSKSPFEFEIVVQDVTAEEDTTFEDLRLSGYSDRGSYKVVTIYDLKNPDEKIRIDSRKSAEENGGFEFIKIHRGASYKQTEVELSKNGIPGMIGYDSKRLSKPLTAASGGGKKGRVGLNRQAQQAAVRGKKPANRAQRGNRNQPRNQGNTNNQNAPAGNANANEGTDRNAVIQRLLERARQNQNGGNAATPNANGSTDAAAPRPRRRRVVLPPSTKK